MDKQTQDRLNKIINKEIEGFGVNGELGIEDLVDYALKSFDFNDNNAAYIALQRIKDKLALQREKKAMNKQTQEALKMAIEWIEGWYGDNMSRDAVLNACKKALEQPVQEPVAWVSESTIDTIEYWENKTPDDCIEFFCAFSKDDEFNIPLYTHPHQWQGLTDDEIHEILEKTPYVEYGSWVEFAQDIEQALKEKNHG